MRDSKGRFIKGDNGFLGKHHSEETKEKLRQQHLGKALSESHRKAIGDANKGKPNSGQFRKGMIPANKGKGQPLEKDIECAFCHKIFHYVRKSYVRSNGYVAYGQFPDVHPDTCRYKMVVSKLKGKSHPEWQGENSYQWRGGVHKGVNFIRHKIQTVAIYAQYRKDCFQRDNYTCVLCGKKGGNLHADHYPTPFAIIIERNNITTLEEAMNCKELWNMDNIRTLCIKCHKKTDTWGITREVFKRRNQL